ncbi:unnamed protein product [Auanema sp. JU1783]|nr:unnamed protein product [Auanema sp. JU1783]
MKLKFDLVFISFLILITGSSAALLSGCVPALVTQCTACCALIFSSSNCSLNDVFRVRINGNGALGAMWDDTAVAVMVKRPCLLEMWDYRNQTGAHRTFGLDGYDVFDLERYGFDRRASSLRCTCQNPPQLNIDNSSLPSE